MSHFSDEIWADFARGLVTDQQHSEIRAHVDSGCAACRSALEMWAGVADVARREPSYEPPPEVVDTAVALYARYRSAEKRSSRSTGATRVAELIFDSFQNPLPAGVRSLERATRHLSYRAGSFFIDVRIEEADQAGTAAVIGQLVHHPKELSMSLEGLSVVLSSGRSTLAETTTNRFGEFSFEMDTAHENHLAIGVGDEFAVVVPLNGRASEI